MMNRVFLTAFITVIIAQILKILYVFLREGHLNFKILTSTGGMPSSHSASVMALTTAVGLETGWDSPLFGVTLFFSLIVMYDATGIRRAAGKQAEILNRIIDDLYQGRTIYEEGEKLKELLGHTPVEVIVGAILGIVLALMLYKYVW